MSNRLQHRGNDASGVWVNDNIGFGHQRLTILDLDSRSNQPFHSKSGKTCITYNGEIYNYKELKKNIPHQESFHTTSDTETLVEMLELMGFSALQKLNGMFAFAAFDKYEKRLMCARDRLGIKPFFYAFHPGKWFVFASEIKALLEFPEISKEIDHQALSDYLSLGYIPGERTIYKDVKKLLPGNYLEINEKGRLLIAPYWEIEKELAADLPKLEIEDFERLIDDSVKLRLLSDVPVGSFLSGGIDSSLISALASKENRQLNTFTIGFEEEKFDESPHAKLIADSLKIPNFTETFTAPTPERIEKILCQFDQPFSDTSAIPTFQLCENAGLKNKTVLSGDGGDEVFAGYETCKADLAQLLGSHFSPLNSMAYNFLSKIISLFPSDRGKVSTNYKVSQFLRYAGESCEKAHYSWRLYFDETEKQQMLNHEISRELKNYDSFSSFNYWYQRFSNFPIRKQHLLVDLKTWLVDDILVKTDICSMANGLEVRTPFLDHRIVEAAMRLSPRAHYNIFKTKKILKSTFPSLLPDSIINRKKEGFSCPVSIWLENELQTFLMDNLSSTGFKRVFSGNKFVSNLMDEHKNRQRDNGFRLWNLLAFAVWQNGTTKNV